MQQSPTSITLTLPALQAYAASPLAPGDTAPFNDCQWVAVTLNAADRISAAEQAEIAEWVRRAPFPVIAIAADPHPATAAFDTAIVNETELQLIARNIAHAPIAAMILMQVLRSTESLPAEQALLMESLAYATLQAGPEFRRWSAAHPPTAIAVEQSPPLLIARAGDCLTLCLNRPERRNAISVEMRDALIEALQLALADPSLQSVVISGNGSCFSVGGDIDEFGTAPDPASAHVIRSLRLPARLLLQCADRLEFRLHSACIGAGMEIPAFGRHVTAARNAFFQLPELRFGLIPGAGGCVSVPRRIGRQRTAYMALSMKKVNAATALAWGLIDAIDD